MAGAGISPSTNTSNIEPSPSNEDDDDHEHPTNHDGNDDESQDVGSHESSEPVVVSPARTPTEEGDDDDDNEVFIHAAAEKVSPPFPKLTETPSKTTAATSISISIPSFTKAGLSKKATPLALKSWAALSLTLDGRDKLTKVFQYITRLLGWWLAGSGSVKHASQRFLSLSKALSTSRKAFRLGRSFVESEKLRSMGLAGLILWHLQGGDESGTSPHPKTVVRRASSNIGWGPMTAMSSELSEQDNQEPKQHRPSSLYRSVSSMAYRKMYRPLLSRMSQSWGLSERPTEELWTAIGSAIKLMALFGFWIGDNVSFLTSSGALDDFEISHKDRMTKRNRLSTLASVRANQAYFTGSIVGLLVNWRTYFVFKRDVMQPAEAPLKQQVVVEEDKDRTMQQLVKLQEKQFSLFLALLKVCARLFARQVLCAQLGV